MNAWPDFFKPCLKILGGGFGGIFIAYAIACWFAVTSPEILSLLSGFGGLVGVIWQLVSEWRRIQ